MRHLLLTPGEAASRMHDGHVVAYPTEAIFGLGCDPANESAVQKILALKLRRGNRLLYIGQGVITALR